MKLKMKKYGNDGVKRYVLDKNRGRPNTRNREHRDKENTNKILGETSTISNNSYVIDGNAIKTLALGESADKINVALHNLDELEKVLNKSENASLDEKENER